MDSQNVKRQTKQGVRGRNFGGYSTCDLLDMGAFKKRIQLVFCTELGMRLGTGLRRTNIEVMICFSLPASMNGLACRFPGST